MNCAIIVHGGASTIPPEEVEATEEGCRAAVMAGWRLLSRGAPALDAAEEAVRVLEANPRFNAGLGSALNADGEVEMDAAIMESDGLRVGAVAGLRGVQHPVSVARRVMESSAVLLCGDGAYRFAAEHCPELCTTASMITEKQRAAWLAREARAQPAGSDTVGCVALDVHGTLACATSTGGLMGKLPGRVGDSPLPGCGLYADELGATALTGDGESIVRTALAGRIVALLHTGGDPDAVAEAAIRYFRAHAAGEAGCILLDRLGRVGFAHNSANMPCAYLSSDMEQPAAFVQKPRYA